MPISAIPVASNTEHSGNVTKLSTGVLHMYIRVLCIDWPIPLDSDPYESIFKNSCAENAPVWKQYMSLAGRDDHELAEVLNGDLESLLLFVSAASQLSSMMVVSVRLHRAPCSPQFFRLSSSKFAVELTMFR